MNAITGNHQHQAEARGAVFRIAAALFDYPLAETQQALSEGRLQQALSEALQETGAQALPKLALSDSLQKLEVGYVAAFMLGKRGRPRVPLVASAYPELLGGESPGGYMLNVQAFYRHFDLQAATDDEGHQDQPDHLVAMLEFCSLLCYLEQRAALKGRDVSPYQRAQHDFLLRCLVPLLTLLRSRFQTEQITDLDAVLAYLIQLLPHWADQQRAALEQVLQSGDWQSQRIAASSVGQSLWD